MIPALMLLAALPPAPAILPAPLPPAPAPDPFGQRAWAHFSRSPALRGTSERVDVATSGVDPKSHVLFYAMRLTRTRFSQPDTVLWADSRTCPAVRPALAALGTLAMPRPSAPGIDPPGDMVLDGVGYALAMPGRFAGGGEGQFSVSSNIGTPLAAWVDRSLKALEPCWSPVELRAP